MSKEPKQHAEPLPTLMELLPDAEHDGLIVRIHQKPKESVIQLYDRAFATLAAAGHEEESVKYITSNPRNYLFVKLAH